MNFKTTSLPFLLVLSLMVTLTSCGKKFEKFDKKEKECSVCTTDVYEDFYNVDPELTQYIVEPITVDPTCECIVDGMVKYTRNGITVALVKYEIADCDKPVAYKVICVNGDCEDKDATCCTFEQVCGNE